MRDTTSTSGVDQEPAIVLRNLPVIAEADAKGKTSLKLTAFFADLTKIEPDAKEARRNKHRTLAPIATAYSIYFYQYIRQHQATGISREKYRTSTPVHLPGGDVFLKRSAFGWRLREYLKAIDATTERLAKLPDVCVPVLRLADDRLVNPGAEFTMTDGQTLLVLAGMHHYPKKGYRGLTRLISHRMAQDDFIYKGHWDCPTESQVRTLMDAVPKNLRTYLAKGYKAYYNSFGLTRTRTYGELNAYWGGDAFFLNEIRFFDPNSSSGDWESPGISYVLEYSCRWPLSVEVHLGSPNAQIGIKLIRDAALPKPGGEDGMEPLYGKCDYFMSDGGVPHGIPKVGEVVSLLGAQPLVIPKGMSAQNGPSERWGGTTKGLIREAIMAVLKEEYPQLRKGKLNLPISQLPKFKEIVMRAINQYRYDNLHSELGVTPYEAVQAAIEEYGIKPLDPKFVMRITSFQVTATVQKTGIELHGKLFFSEDLQGIVGETVECIIDPFEEQNPSVMVLHHGELICTAPLMDPASDSKIRDAIRGPVLRKNDAMKELIKDLNEAHKALFKTTEPSLQQARDSQRAVPDLDIPNKLGQLPDLFKNLYGDPRPWSPSMLVDTHALRVIDAAAREVAGNSRVLVINAPRGHGLTMLGRALNARASQIPISGKALHVEVLSPETGDDLPKQIVDALGIEVSNKAAMQKIASELFTEGVAVLYVDNAHHLNEKTLTFIAGLPRQQAQQSLAEQQELMPQPVAKLGIILAGHCFTEKQLKAVRDASNFERVETLPHLAFGEMAALLAARDDRFEGVLEMAKAAGTPEIKFLRTYYAMTEGSFARFEYILGRLEPLLAILGPLSLAEMSSVLNQYAVNTVPPELKTSHTILPD